MWWEHYRANYDRYAASNPISVTDDDPYHSRPRPYYEDRGGSRHRTLEAVDRLLDVLSNENRERYLREREVFIAGSAGGDFRVDCAGYTGNIYEEENGRVITTWCAHPAPAVATPDGYRYLPLPVINHTQILWIMADEPGFRRVANVYPF